MPRVTHSLRVSPTANNPMIAHAVCEAVLSPCPRRFGSSYDPTVSPHPPSAFCTDRFQSAQHLHGAVNVVHTPAPKPAPVRLLLFADKLNRPLHRRMTLVVAISRQ